MTDAYRRSLEREVTRGNRAVGAKLDAELNRTGMLEKCYVFSKTKARTATMGQKIYSLRQECKAAEYSPQPTTIIRGKNVYRPLSFAETLRARVEDFNRLRNTDGSERSLGERLSSWNYILNTCTGIAHKAGTAKFKIIPFCNQIIGLPRKFNQPFLECDYDSLDGIELDRVDRKSEYGEWLTRDQVLVHPAWIEAAKELTPDAELLKDYSRIAFDDFPRHRPETNPDRGMEFFCSTGEKDNLHLLAVGNTSSAYGTVIAEMGYDRFNLSGFLRVCPR